MGELQSGRGRCLHLVVKNSFFELVEETTLKSDVCVFFDLVVVVVVCCCFCVFCGCCLKILWLLWLLFLWFMMACVCFFKWQLSFCLVFCLCMCFPLKDDFRVRFRTFTVCCVVLRCL